MGGVFSSDLTEAACVVHLFKINGYSATRAMGRTDSLPSKRLALSGYEWEVHYTPSQVTDGYYAVAFKLVLLSAPRRSDVKAALRCRLVSPSSTSNQERLGGNRDVGQTSHAFKQAKESSPWVVLCKRSVLEASGAIREDSFTVECTITVIVEPADKKTADVLLPSSGLHHHLGELLRNGTGSDVRFVVSGESFVAHKAILASRSPVFMAQFFGRMWEEHPEEVIEIEDMEPVIFRVMLHFIYTDSVPELERQGCAIVAQHLLAAADRYGLDRLKLMCEYKLYDGISVNTAATTLALAEQHNCLHLKARCVEIIAANLDAVMATEGYRHLMASCPMIVNDLLKAVVNEPRFQPAAWSPSRIASWFHSLTDDISSQRTKGLCSLTVLVVWIIWKERNARIFQHKEQPCHRIVRLIKEEVNLWAAAGAKFLSYLLASLM